MVIFEKCNLLNDYEEVRKRIAELKEGELHYEIPTHNDIKIDNMIRDEVINLMTIANKHHVDSRVWENKMNGYFALSFYKKKKNRT